MSYKKIIFLIVLYRKKCEESETLISLMPQLNGNSVYVWDNSLVKDDGAVSWLSSKSNCYKYFSCPENKPLSYVYGQLISVARSGSYTHLVLLDQDSILDAKFVTSLEAALTNNMDSILVPDVFIGDLFVSPSQSWKWFGWNSALGERLNNSLITAINSGLCIPVSQLVSTGFSFPVGLENYGTDVYLFEHVRKHNIDVVLTHSKIQHDLTFHKSNADNDSYFNSYVLHMRAMKTIFSDGVFGFIFFNFYVFFHGLKVALIRWDRRFLTWWMYG